MAPQITIKARSVAAVRMAHDEVVWRSGAQRRHASLARRYSPLIRACTEV